MGMIGRIKKKDLKGFVEEKFTAENVVFSVVGAVDKEAVGDIIDNSFFGLLERKYDGDVLPEVVFGRSKEVIRIDRDIPQSVILFGVPAVRRDDGQFYPAYVMNHIIGGSGFESRLMRDIREDNGLAYGVYSAINIMRYAGVMQGYATTDNANADIVVDKIKEHFDRMARHGVSSVELGDAKDYLRYSFPLRMTKNSSLVGFLSGMQFYGLGEDFLQKRNSYVEDVSIDELDRVAYELLKVDDLVVVVVGNEG